MCLPSHSHLISGCHFLSILVRWSHFSRCVCSGMSRNCRERNVKLCQNAKNRSQAADILTDSERHRGFWGFHLPACWFLHFYSWTFWQHPERPRKTCTSTGVKGTYIYATPFSPRIGDALSRLDSLRSGIVITGGGRMESELSSVQESEVSEEPAEKLFAEGLWWVPGTNRQGKKSSTQRISELLKTYLDLEWFGCFHVL